MSRYSLEIAAEFESLDETGKIQLFKVVVEKLTTLFQNGRFSASINYITEILEIFQSMDEESPSVIEIANAARKDLLELQYTDNELYNAQIFSINELLDFLRPYQTLDEYMFNFEDETNITTTSDGSSAAVATATTSSTAAPPTNTEIYYQRGDMLANMQALSAQYSELCNDGRISGSPVTRRKSSEGDYTFLGKMAFSPKDLKKSPFDDDYGDGTI